MTILWYRYLLHFDLVQDHYRGIAQREKLEKESKRFLGRKISYMQLRYRVFLLIIASCIIVVVLMPMFQSSIINRANIKKIIKFASFWLKHHDNIPIYILLCIVLAKNMVCRLWLQERGPACLDYRWVRHGWAVMTRHAR
jgi:hypothetical protein